MAGKEAVGCHDGHHPILQLASDTVGRLVLHPMLESVARGARARRWKVLSQWFPELASMAVLDLGGAAEAWFDCPIQPKHVVSLNTDSRRGESPAAWITTIVADACDPPSDVRGQHFDLVYSNSLIEHVGGHFRRTAFADVVHSLAPRHWVQTPYRYFPIEPHWLFPGFQFLPVQARGRITRSWSVGHMKSAAETAIEDVLDVELLSKTEMRHYFPASDIISERFAGMTKSIIAVR